VDVRESILQAGVTLLKEQGIAALTQPRVAKAAGVKQSHLTYYFPKRADLLLGIAEYSIEKVTAGLAARLEDEAQPAALAGSISSALIDGVPPRIMLGLVVAADVDPEIRAPLQKLVRHVRGRIQGILEKAGIADSGNAALQFHATIIGLAVMHEAQQTAESANELTSGLNGMLRLIGVMPPESGKDAK